MKSRCRRHRLIFLSRRNPSTRLRSGLSRFDSWQEDRCPRSVGLRTRGSEPRRLGSTPSGDAKRPNPTGDRHEETQTKEEKVVMSTITLLLTPWMAPHKVISWQRAVVLLWLGKVDVLEEYDESIVGPSLVLRTP